MMYKHPSEEQRHEAATALFLELLIDPALESHLQECADCRRLVEEEVAEMAAVRAVLSGAAGVTQRPPRVFVPRLSPSVTRRLRRPEPAKRTGVPERTSCACEHGDALQVPYPGPVEVAARGVCAGVDPETRSSSQSGARRALAIRVGSATALATLAVVGVCIRAVQVTPQTAHAASESTIPEARSDESGGGGCGRIDLVVMPLGEPTVLHLHESLRSPEAAISGAGKAEPPQLEDVLHSNGGAMALSAPSEVRIALGHLPSYEQAVRRAGLSAQYFGGHGPKAIPFSVLRENVFDYLDPVDQTRICQIVLAHLKLYPEDEIDGLYGAITRRGVVAFQERENRISRLPALPEDGRLRRETTRRLLSEASAGALAVVDLSE